MNSSPGANEDLPRRGLVHVKFVGTESPNVSMEFRGVVLVTGLTFKIKKQVSISSRVSLDNDVNSSNGLPVPCLNLLHFNDTASGLFFRDIWILTDSRASIQAHFSLDNCLGYGKSKYSGYRGSIFF
ncbi:hypothetical protein TNCV_1016911 [Trichonephila clavipes]|uniref:Uncharacterized protein n=1 Tax=Trichonephila clavipes TaxID=2585209 RepID=A0A8X7B9Z5_TRICX|nr:hypothetical protein TNCV_1016911 [Trichonephila clavipes]